MHMGIQDIIAIGIVLAAVLWIVRRFVRASKSSGCRCGCTPQTGPSAASRRDRTGLKQTPLVRPDQIGLPTANHQPTSQPSRP